jgi:hypothetical protein
MTLDPYARGDCGLDHAGAPFGITLREPDAPYGPPKRRLLDRVREAMTTMASKLKDVEEAALKLAREGTGTLGDPSCREP